MSKQVKGTKRIRAVVSKAYKESNKYSFQDLLQYVNTHSRNGVMPQTLSNILGRPGFVKVEGEWRLAK